MYENKHKELIEALKETRIRLSKSAEESKKFLIELGVVTKKGKLTKKYKNLYIPNKDESR